MQLALYTPGLGYYSAPNIKLGREGDFVTAPEISPLFTRCLARQCQQILQMLPEGDILELGAGSGVLAKDLLLELESLNTLPQHYYIFETSEDLRQRQQSLLKASCPHLYSRIIWLESLTNVAITGCIFANEVLDALPTHCFRIENQTVVERCVTFDNNRFSWKTTAPTTEAITQLVTPIMQECALEDGYESEVNLMLAGFITTLAHTLKQGVLLLLDYGYGQREYYHPDRRQGTLMCYYQHHKQDNPFLFVGLQDITAHVDFTAVADNALAAGLKFKGYTTQTSFLMATGLLELAQSATLSDKELFRQNQAIKTLTMPSEMGESIKVIGLSKELDISLIGFSLHDRSRDL